MEHVQKDNSVVDERQIISEFNICPNSLFLNGRFHAVQRTWIRKQMEV